MVSILHAHLCILEEISLQRFNDAIKHIKIADAKYNASTEGASRVTKTSHMKPEPIFIHIHSPGGGAYLCGSILDVVEHSKVPIYTVVDGYAASAGSILAVAGHRRFMRPSSSILIHQLRGGMYGTMHNMEDSIENSRQLHEWIKRFYADHTKLEYDDLEEILKHDLFWKADKCIEVGLTDEIFTHEMDIVDEDTIVVPTVGDDSEDDYE